MSRTRPASTSRRERARRSKDRFHALDPLESRTLLSVTIASNGKSAAYIDANGNPVTITFSQGNLTAGLLNFTNILAGYTTDGTPIDRHAQIGTVSVSANLTATNIVAGSRNAISNNTSFGDANDARIPANGSSDTAAPLATIASIKVGGTVSGTDSGVNSADHFGFVAQSVGSVTIAGSKVALNSAPDTDDVAIGSTGDFNVHEV